MYRAGDTPWNKGLNKNDERMAKIARKLTGRKHTSETIKKLKFLLGGKNHHNYGKHLSEETRRRIGIANKNKTRSEELRKRISLSLKGRPLSEETKLKMLGRIPWNKGKDGYKIHTLEHRLSLSERMKGEKHWAWKGGVTTTNEKIRKSLEYRLWREEVFKKDNWHCVICGLRQGWNKELKRKIHIEADHIKPFSLFPELRLDVDNGRVLCHDCHRKTSTYGGDTKYKIGHQ